MTQPDMAEVAVLLRRLLDAVEAGELEAESPTARALVQRLEGAAFGLEQAAQHGGRRRP